MFLKRIRAASKKGKQRTYWALVKSIRTARGPRHQVVAYLGELQAGEKTEWANLARIVNRRPILGMPLFEPPETTEPVPETIEVRVRGARVERTRDFGSVYLALTLWRMGATQRRLLPASYELGGLESGELMEDLHSVDASRIRLSNAEDGVEPASHLAP